MEILGERPAWSLNDSEKLPRLDASVAEINRMKTYYLQLVADLDASGYAKEIGAGDTARFLSQRYLIDPVEARRDLRLATALPKYETVSAAIPDPAKPFADHTDDPEDTAEDEAQANAAENNAAEDDAESNAATDGAQGNEPANRSRRLNLDQAAAIVSALEKVSTTVPVENLQVAEQQLVKLARTFNPKQLRDAANRIRNILDTDGPEPDERRAYQRESLTLKPADNGVKFGGYLANENAELFRTLIHAGAKPLKTLDGEPDPRIRGKRQADALTDLLSIAAGVTHTTTCPNPSREIGGCRTAAEADHPGNTDPTTDSEQASRASGIAPDSAHGIAPSGHPASRSGDTNAGDGSGDTSSGAGGDTSSGAGGDTSSGGSGDTAGANGADSGGSSTSTGDSTPSGYIPGHGPKAHLTITIDYHALKTATAQATGDIVFGDALSAAAVRRLACDAQVLPLVLGSKSQPLDVGTSKRLVTGPMRLALNARDRGCVVCGAPPIQCEAHHLVHWIDGGETCVSNLVLLCKRHHIDLHAGHWHIEIIDGVVHVTRPIWAMPDRIPRGRYRPSTLDDAAIGSMRTAGQAWTRDADRGRDTTADAAYLAIWGDDPPTSAGASRSPRAAGTQRTAVFAAAPSVAADLADEGCLPGQVIAGGAARTDPWGDHATSAAASPPDRESVRT